MEKPEDVELKSEIDAIMDRVNGIMEKVDTLDPAKKAPEQDSPSAVNTDG
jgi:hypothetical protein